MARDSSKCGTCGKRIIYSNGYERRDGLQAKRIISIRKHYKKDHPGKFKEMIKKGVAKRRAGLRFNKAGKVQHFPLVKFVKPKLKRRKRQTSTFL